MNTNNSPIIAPAMEHHDQTEIKSFGFWIYLMSDLVLFSVLFATFGVIGFNYAGGPHGKNIFDLRYLFIETMFLLISSFVFGLTMISLHNGDRIKVLWGLAFTFLLGLGFIVMEIHEFGRLVHEGFGPDRSGFLSAFFTLVGTHGIHVASGLIWILVMIGQVATTGITRGVNSRLMRLSLFWHFLDIVWIGVFSFVYLVGML